MLDEVEAAHAAEGNVVRFPPTGSGNVRKARVKKAKAATATEAVSAAHKAIVAPQADDSPPAAAIAPGAVSAAHKATVAPAMAHITLTTPSSTEACFRHSTESSPAKLSSGHSCLSAPAASAVVHACFGSKCPTARPSTFG